MTSTVFTDWPQQSCQVFAADDIYVSSGVNHDEGLALPDDLCFGDIYRLQPAARPLHLILSQVATEPRVAPGSEIGAPGEKVELVARYRMMSASGDVLELLLMRPGRGVLCALPLSPIDMRSEYTLVAVEPAPESVILADLMCVSLARGTLITLGDGRKRPVETLTVGDKVRTRSRGSQPLRWVGRAVVRATGAFAPIVIGKGALGNVGDLVVSQHQRVFLNQPSPAQSPNIPERLVQAKNLVDNASVCKREGGFIDYFSLGFDHHEIIYAEGIPVESLMVNEATVTRLPAELAAQVQVQVQVRFPGLSQVQHFGIDASRYFPDHFGLEALRPTAARSPGLKAQV